MSEPTCSEKGCNSQVVAVIALPGQVLYFCEEHNEFKSSITVTRERPCAPRPEG